MAQSITTPPRSSLLQRMIKGRWIGNGFLYAIGLIAVVGIAIKAYQSPALFVNQLVNGLQLGFVYALIALGYTMVYGIVKLINFAHGDVFMVGAFISYYAISGFQLHLWPLAVFPNINPTVGLLIGTVSVILLSMLTCALLAVTVE